MNQQNALWNSLQQARFRSDRLFDLLCPRAIYERAVAERHRFIFYRGHLEAFDWNLLAIDFLRREPFHPEWDSLFAFGIDPESTDLPTDSAEDWPSEESVQAYCEQTRREIDDTFSSLPAERIHVAIEHRLMHLETLAYLLHNLDHSLKLGTDEQAETRGALGDNPLLAIPEGAVTLGQDDGCFGWDNEFPRNTQEVASFRIQRHKVTNGEYLRFVDQGAAPPHFWSRQGGGWRLRRMFSHISLPLDWPVWVTHMEASAYAAWKGWRLPSEAEFHRAAYGTPEEGESVYPWGGFPPSPDRGNFDFRQWNPCAVDATPAGDSAFGVSQLVGNGWEWTSTVFHPFNGFQPAPFYPGYSADFFDDKHYVLKGASPRTAAPLLRRPFRNWFRGEYQYAFTGFRCVSDD